MVTPPPTTPAAILARTREVWAALDAALTRIPDAELLCTRTAEGWSLKDTLAHLSNPWLTAEIEAHLDARDPTPFECYGHDIAPGPEVDITSNDARNAWHHSINQRLTLDQVRARYLDFRARTEAILWRLPESEGDVIFALVPFGHIGRLRPALPGEPLAFPLWQWLRGETWHHYEDHLRAFDAAAATFGGAT